MTKISLLTIAAASLLAACGNGDYSKTKSGITYKIVEKGSGPQVKRGQFLKVQFTQRINDSILQTSVGGVPAYARVDSVGPIYNPAEVFDQLHKGGSVVIIQEVDTLMKKSPMMPPFMKKGDKMRLGIRVLDILPDEAAVQANQAEEIKGQEARDLALVEAYLQKNNIKAEKVGKGVYVVVTEPGTGVAADSGKYVSVKYRGKLLETGKEFESTMEAGKDPYTFPLGMGQVIPGWDQGLKKFAKGGKGVLYIPGFMAYGMRPGPGGKANEALLFDVEMVNVSDSAPAPKQNPMLPPVPNQPAQK
ncbi:MAG TPA: FKBP-type peptidyl-prolyl cis-trans isomerase [Flavihumibacter sp.]|nr:FKBP-type peptidyl-prolyl cis-trans isomerase [Flavihumibacter sp.]